MSEKGEMETPSIETFYKHYRKLLDIQPNVSNTGFLVSCLLNSQQALFLPLGFM